MAYLSEMAALPEARRPSLLWTLTAFSGAVTLLGLVWAAAGDPRMVGDAPAHAKPLKFAVSFVAFFATLALVEARLSEEWRRGRLLRGAGAVMAVSFVAEMAWMIHQAARGEASHFNGSTPLAFFMYYVVMAAGAVALVACVGLYGWAAWRDRAARLGPATRAGVALGFGLSFGLTMIVAGWMSVGTGHHVGLPSEGAAVLPLFGWSAEVGDLRPAHFLSLHAMQALPLLGLWLDRRGAGGRGILWAGGAYAALTLAVFVQALMGLPLIRL